jgi:hypothetical protein
MIVVVQELHNEVYRKVSQCALCLCPAWVLCWADGGALVANRKELGLPRNPLLFPFTI